MRARDSWSGGWQEDGYAERAPRRGHAADYDAEEFGGDFGEEYDDAPLDDYAAQHGAPYADVRYEDAGYDDDELGLMLPQEQSLVHISQTVTQHGAPLLSYTRTMSRFYANRKQRLSLGRYNCEVCGERIRWLAWESANGNRTHDGCYERLAWTWTHLYAQQQRLADQGEFE